jgi:pyruvate formate-lyase activating enzyme-like uncharacterized protein
MIHAPLLACSLSVLCVHLTHLRFKINVSRLINNIFEWSLNKDAPVWSEARACTVLSDVDDNSECFFYCCPSMFEVFVLFSLRFQRLTAVSNTQFTSARVLN